MTLPVSIDEAHGSAQEVVMIERIFAAQRANRYKVGQRSAAERIAKLRRLRGAIIAHQEALYEAMSADFCKPRDEFELVELQPTLSEISFAIKHLERWMRPQRVGTPLVLLGTRSEIRYEPKGVVLILAPWNYPFRLLITPLVAAVAAGNCAIVRPSEKVPHTAQVLAAIIADVFPEDEVALVGGEIEVADALLQLPFDHIFFTGSTRIGRKVMAAAAQTLASVTLELGGKSPAIIDASADVPLAAERLIWGKFLNAGQTCVAPDYVLVHEAQAADFVRAARAAIVQSYGATEQQRRRCTDLCRVIDAANVRRLRRLVEEAVAQGAVVELGGIFDEQERYVAPTILSNVSPSSPLMEEEIFGPVLPVLTFRTLDEALALINGRPKPLALYIFSKNTHVSEHIIANTSAGGTVINNTVVHLANSELPFGGVGESGQGSYHGEFGFRTFSHARPILTQSRFNSARRFFPPYTPLTRKLLKITRRLVSR